MSNYNVVVGLGNPENVAELMRVGCMMAREYGGRVEGLTVIETDEVAPKATSETHDRMSRAYAILDHAEQIAEAYGANFEGHLAISRPVAEAIDDLAQSIDAELIVVGYSERYHPDGHSNFERLVDEIATHAPCNLLVARFVGRHASYDRVLAPVRERLNLDVRRDLVLALQHQFGSTVDVVHFACSENQAAEKHDELEKWLIERGVLDYVNLQVRVREDPAQAIVEASADYDLVVLGTAPLHEVRRKYFGPVSEHVANHATCSTFLVRTREIHPAD